LGTADEGARWGHRGAYQAPPGDPTHTPGGTQGDPVAGQRPALRLAPLGSPRSLGGPWVRADRLGGWSG